jgi:hypothetical protein
LTEKERRNLRKAADFEGLDSEISMLRVKINSVIEDNPENVDLIVRATNALRKMLVTRSSMVRQDQDAEAIQDEKGGIRQAVIDVLQDTAFSDGVGIGSVPRE